MAKFLISRSVKLDANGNGVDHVGGAVVIVSTLSIGPSVDITWLDGGGNESGTAQGILSGQKAHAGADFAGIKLKGQPNDVCSLYVGPTDASLDSLNALNAVIGHVIVDNEVEVKNDAGNALACDVPGAQKLSDNADAQGAAGAASLQGVIARLAAWNGATFDRLKIGGVAGSLFADVADRAGRLLGIVTSTSTTVAAETIADNADAQAAKGANVLQGVVSRLQAWNGATFDRLKIGGIAGSLLADLGDRAGRLVGIVYGSLGQLVQRVVAGVNALVVHLQNDGFADDSAVNNGAFMFGQTKSGVAGQLSLVQTFNPAGSGVFTYVDAVTLYCGAADTIDIRTHNAALGALIAQFANKNVGGAAGLSALRTGSEAAASGTSIGRVCTVANTTLRVPFCPPIRLPAGTGCHVETASLNEQLTASFEVREKAT